MAYLQTPFSHEKILDPKDTPYFIDNEFRYSTTHEFVDVHDPATNSPVTRVPLMTKGELKESVASAQNAFHGWRGMSVIARQQIMFRYVGLIKENCDRIAAIITLEQGKTLSDAKGDVLRGLQVAEAACAGPEYMKGEVLEVAKDMETRTYREPLGVVTAICPFSQFSSIPPFPYLLLFVQGIGENALISRDRFSSYGTPVVYSNRHYYWQHDSPQAVRT